MKTPASTVEGPEAGHDLDVTDAAVGGGGRLVQRLTLRTKAILFLVPVIVFISAAYTYQTLRTEKAMLRAEVLKRGETVAAIAGKTAELPILSENRAQLEKAARPLKSIQDVSYVVLYDRHRRPLLHEGVAPVDDLPTDLSPQRPVTSFETPHFFEFIVPVFTAREGAEIDIYQEPGNGRTLSEHIGWVRIGISQYPHRRAIATLIRNGALLGLLFGAGGVAAVYLLIGVALRPLDRLLEAVRGLRDGDYVEILPDTTADEVGRLSEEFCRMSSAIRERERKILASRRRLDALFERVEHAIFRLDPRGNIVECNRKFSEMFPEARNLAGLFLEERTDEVFRALNGEMRHAEQKLRGGEDGECTAIMSVYPEVDADGAICGFDGYVVDVSEKKRLEEALIQTQKLESIGLLAGGIAHDFNNILAGILGYAELLKYEKDAPSGERVAEYALMIEKSVLRAAGLTQQLLGFARKGKFKTEAIDLNRLVRELSQFLQETLDRNISVAVNTDANLPAIEGDSTQLYQALLNLCINARDAMPEGGYLTISTKVCDVEVEEVRDSFRIPAGNYARVDVMDTGTGIPPEVKKRMFEPFFTTKEVGKGTGLGLSMVYGIITNHGGFVDVTSQPGFGTVMRIYLPSCAEEPSVETTVSEETSTYGAGTILLVDDEEVVRRVTKHFLETRSYRVLDASDGRHGVELFREHKDSVDLVLLDMVMPQKSGREVFKEIRALKPDAKVMLCSGHDRDEYFQELFELGAVGFVQKPASMTELLREVEKALKAGSEPAGAEESALPSVRAAT